MKIPFLALIVYCVCLFGPASQGAPLGTAFTYQGRLQNAQGPATGVYDFQFSLWDAAINGTQSGSVQAANGIAVTNGLFTATLDFGDIFSGNPLWLNISVRTNGATLFSPLSPRQALTPAPYAVTSLSASNLLGALPATHLIGTLPSAQLAGSYTGPVVLSNAANRFVGEGSGLTALNASNLLSGTLPDARLASNVARTNQVWLLNGNSGTTPAGNFIGTSDNQPLSLRVNGQAALNLKQCMRHALRKQASDLHSGVVQGMAHTLRLD